MNAPILRQRDGSLLVVFGNHVVVVAPDAARTLSRYNRIQAPIARGDYRAL